MTKNNKLQELKILSKIRKEGYEAFVCHCLLEQVLVQVHKESQNPSEVLPFPVVEIVDQQGNNVRK
jgi:hypothetical protein